MAADTAGGSSSAIAVDGFLARFDAIVRMAEMKALRANNRRADSTVAELRSLRAKTYDALREAVDDSASVAPRGTRSGQLHE